MFPCGSSSSLDLAAPLRPGRVAWFDRICTHRPQRRGRASTTRGITGRCYSGSIEFSHLFFPVSRRAFPCGFDVWSAITEGTEGTCLIRTGSSRPRRLGHSELAWCWSPHFDLPLCLIMLINSRPFLTLRSPLSELQLHGIPTPVPPQSRCVPGFLSVPPAHLVHQSALSGLKNSLRTGGLRWQRARCGWAAERAARRA